MKFGFDSLKKRSQFLLIRKHGQTIKSEFLIINFLKTKNPDKKTNFGLTVSKRVGNAVKRNYIKRLIRAVLIKNKRKISSNLQIEIIPKKSSTNLDFISLEKDLIEKLLYIS